MKFFSFFSTNDSACLLACVFLSSVSLPASPETLYDCSSLSSGEHTELHKMLNPLIVSDDVEHLATKIPELEIIYWSEHNHEVVAIAQFRRKKGALIIKHAEASLKWMNPPEFDLFLLKNESLLKRLLESPEFLLNWIDCQIPKAWYPAFKKNPTSFIFRLGHPTKNYTLAAIIGEDLFYPDLTQQDFLISFLHLPVLQFTEHQKLNKLYFWHVTDLNAQNFIESQIDQYTSQGEILNEVRSALSLIAKEPLDLSISQDNPLSYLDSIEKILGSMNLAYDFENIPDEFYRHLSQNIQVFCASNGIFSIKALSESHLDFISALADRFLMAKTTAFFRDWREMGFLDNWLKNHQLILEKENRFSRIKIFGCSTGQEPLSLAIHFHQHNFHNFKILATDVDPLVIEEAKTFTYPGTQFENISEDRKHLLLDTYFQKSSSNKYTLRYPQFFENRIVHTTQDITKPLLYPPEIAPPYDMIMVKNVLLYIEPQIVQQTITDIAKMVAPGGLLWIKDKFHSVKKYRKILLKDFLPISPYVAIKKTHEFEPHPEHMLRLFEPYLTDDFLIAFISSLKNSHKLSEIKDILEAYPVYSHSIAKPLLEWLISLQNKDYIGAYHFFKHIILTDPPYFHILSELREKDFEKVLKHHFPITQFQSIFNRILDPNVRVETLSREIDKLHLENISPECLLLICESLSYKDLGIITQHKTNHTGSFIEYALKLLNSHPKNNTLFLIQEWISLMNIAVKFYPSMFKIHIALLNEKINLIHNKNLMQEMSVIAKIELSKILQQSYEMNEISIPEWSKLVLQLLDIPAIKLINIHETTLSDYYFSKALAQVEEIKLSTNPISQEKYKQEALENLNEVVRLNTVYSQFALKWIRLLKNKE